MVYCVVSYGSQRAGYPFYDGEEFLCSNSVRRAGRAECSSARLLSMRYDVSAFKRQG